MAILDSNRIEGVKSAWVEEKAFGKTVKEESGMGTAQKGLRFQRKYTKPGENVFSTVEWETRDAVISGSDGEIVFEQKGVEIPKTWSQLATNVVVSKYFRGTLGTTQREFSVRQLIARVADTITSWGERQQYFASPEDRDTFHDELTYLLLHQHLAFNSPVWFNVGVEKEPQCSACFINSVEDTMPSILELAKTEGMLFKFGSGTGSNLSPIRSSKEQLGGGGTASGPVSFMKGYDAFAGVIKSGGKTRRAAKMVILNVDHPDIVEFIECKSKEERKAWTLIDAGYDGSFNGEAYSSIFFQNANHSVRVTDDFMDAVENDADWHTRYVMGGDIYETYKAKQLLRKMAESAHQCGDPGVQFDSTINRWHTCPNSGRINASNPCSEYMFLDDTACNLASLNLMKYYDAESQVFDVEGFEHSVEISISAQEMLVDNASYPTEKIDQKSHIYRTLGLGYANLGALLMANGLPYNSDEGRAYAACISSLMSGHANLQSARIAKEMGPFEGFAANREPMINVMKMHRDESYKIDSGAIPEALRIATTRAWDNAVEAGEQYGYRNAQVTVIAPTGTIGFMMDCDTTGIEPDIALVKYKNLVGGGVLKIVNNTVPTALQKLGYSPVECKDIITYIDQNDTIEGAPHLRDEDLPVFDCAFRPQNGKRSIHYMGHIKMMAAVQPFISGAISKTVNMPNSATVEDVENAYLTSWKLGLKALAIYRDGCKRSQPLNTGKTEKKQVAAAKILEDANIEPKPYRKRLSDERQAITHKFNVGGHEGYITVGLYEDGQPGEIFLTMAKEGSVVSGLVDGFATAISLALQYGVPIEVLVKKFSHTRFEPSGMTDNKEIPFAKSILDYIFRWLASRFMTAEQGKELGIHFKENTPKIVKKTNGESNGNGHNTNGNGNGHSDGNSAVADDSVQMTFVSQDDAPACHVCSTIMVRNGACYKCCNCGATSGCS